MSRESLIYALNESMKKKEELPDVKIVPSKFDPATGTFYCGDNVAEYGITNMQEAKKFFEITGDFYRNSKTAQSDSENFKKAQYCEIAVSAIKYLIESGNINN